MIRLLRCSGRKFRRSALLAITASLSITVVAAVSTPATATQREGPFASQAKEPHHDDDLDGYADFNHVDSATAATDLALQHEVESVGESLSENPAVTAFWIANVKAWSLTIGMKSLDQADSILQSLPEDLQPLTSFVVQSYSESEFGSQLEWAVAKLRAQGLYAGGSVDARAQEVDIQVPQEEVATAQSVLADFLGGAGIGSRFRVLAGDASPTADVYGGLGLAAGCTTGFSVVRASDGHYGVSSAGHCPDGNTTVSTGTHTNLYFRGGWLSGSSDLQWYGNDNADFPPWATDNTDDATPFYRVISSTIPRLSLVDGGTYCKWGVHTGYGCGSLTGRYDTPAWVSSVNATFLDIDNSSVVLSQGGDSGGPVYASDSAIGIISGQANSGHRLVAMSMDGFTGKGITVRTS